MHDDHRERAERLLSEGKPLSIHFNGEMYVHGSFVHVPLWVGDTLTWATLPNCGTPGFGAHEEATQVWRRRMLVS